MATYEIAEAEEKLEALIEAAERGEEMLIARDGKAVARMTSMGKRSGSAANRLVPQGLERF